MAQKKKKTDVDVLGEIRWTSDVEVEDSSDSCVEMEEEEDEDFLLRRDPVYDQEDPELSRSSSSDNDAEEEEDGCKPSSEPVKRQVASASKRRSSSSANVTQVKKCQDVSRRAGQATSTHGNEDKNMWHSPDEPDTDPQAPKFAPKHPPGPQIDATKSWSPLNLFKLFFSTSTIRTIIQNTNMKAKRTIAAGKKFKWIPLTVDNFYIFLSIIIFTGLVQVPSRTDLWRTKWPYNFNFPRQCMSRDKFEAIFWSIHLSNIKEDDKNQKKKGTPQYDRLFKIRPLYDEIKTACRSVFQPGREICVDERVVASKARLGLRQHMDKHQLGYKLFVLADSNCGYTWNFFIYDGKTERVQQEGLSFTSVMDLMEFKLIGKGYHLYVDSFYTSPSLFHKLSANHTGACGTIRQTRVGFPKTTRNNLPKSAERGDMRWLRKDGLLFLKWKGAKEVTVCSTFHKAYSGDTMRRRVKEGGQWIFKNIAVPDAVRDCNKFMGGVGLSDALIQYYSVKGKTMKWYKTFFYHFLDIAVVNSYILFKMLAVGRGEAPMLQRKFREVLMQELIDESRAVAAAAAPKPSPSNMCLPAYYGSTATDHRRQCVLCKAEGKITKTPVYCSKCNVALCFVSDRNCFKDFHLKV
ncbi:piggyBac transposable element-derived protein 4-like [Girardinichthys multiradiatus]|uniref:piggyBac transposable element-derived protein 4-like n=1 Tax=Girardinichthys multiradiatus TaxID=208333 RepID=UPI001FAB57F1|nr:piggyBac transposable element-derived protein 4-like [Girardinichthys multiradiatus]XP_047239377.1 piggyBac transposable element-derived protein 4-like [Girardinichthys multiradiatus]